ncbi:MAG: aminotransferase class V-fold PLP-dependent enzyme, partial [Phaeodactylibacter sp.]|nr:aminotransferase class V-fold PLP-dependent enzyme [Phaeodactylibacter sp.]
IVFLDSAASSQKPNKVIDAVSDYYRKLHANVHRGVYQLSQDATAAFEVGREKARAFINAASSSEVIFVRGATEGINLVASSFGRKFLRQGDEVVVTAMEHHSNIVPWQLICEEKGAFLRVAPINDAGELIMSEFEKLLNDKTRIVAATYVSNALGTVNPVAEIVALAHARGIPVLVDGA